MFDGDGIRQNTEAIGRSSTAIDTNTKAIAESTSGTTSLIPALQGVQRLDGPMRSVAALDPTMRSVAALSEPMSRVALLDPSMRALAELQQPMTRLVEIRGPLDAVSALGGPMTRVADMRESLDAVASLRDSLDQVSPARTATGRGCKPSGTDGEARALRQPLEQVGALAGPMSRLAALTSILDRPMLLIAMALAALAAWGLVTFLAVRMAIVSARRSDPARQSVTRHHSSRADLGTPRQSDAVSAARTIPLMRSILLSRIGQFGSVDTHCARPRPQPHVHRALLACLERHLLLPGREALEIHDPDIVFVEGHARHLGEAVDGGGENSGDYDPLQRSGRAAPLFLLRASLSLRFPHSDSSPAAPGSLVRRAPV